MLDQDAKMGVPYNRVVVKEPMGVVGAITPWNFPFEIISNKVGQILATGNTMVLKPAIETPWSALRWGRIIAEKTDIPAGVVNIVPASNNDIAQVLATDPRTDMVSFTGSTAVGKLIQRLSGDTMKRNMLELGGKSAYLLLDDADMDMALPGCIGALMHSGQGCALATRMLVPRSHYDQAVEVASATFGALAVGDPSDPNTFCGPLVSAKQRDRVLNYIEIAKRDGGRITAGGGVPKAWIAGTSWRRPSCRTSHRTTPSSRRRCSVRCCPSRPTTAATTVRSSWRITPSMGSPAGSWAPTSGRWPSPAAFVPGR